MKRQLEDLLHDVGLEEDLQLEGFLLGGLPSRRRRRCHRRFYN